MRLSYNWLKEYIDLTDVTPQELADKMTIAGLEVEGIEYVANATNLVIGEVLECVPHPDSDHLHVTKTRIGTGEDDVVQIVCGAPNVAAGEKVIVAKVGAVLPELTIAKRDVRGQESNGMICALYEIGVDKKYLSEEQQNGIEILADDAPVGETEVLKYLGLDDVILDVSLTPNRADCTSMWNMAKEVGAILKREAHWPDCKGRSDIGEKGTFKVATKTEKCPMFYGKVVNHIKIGPSPEWMKQYLHSYGMNSINNVVDISNIVMIETGQPLHYYNLAKLPAREITVVDDRDLDIVALDGKTFHAQPGDLLITTNGEATGIAGIMGGEESMIDDSTTGIFIEAAQFNQAQVRRTSIRLNLLTEASQRYAKGLEPLGPIKALDRSVQLLQEYAEADGFEETVFAGHLDYEPKIVKETMEHCNALLGTQFTAEQAMDVLEALDFKPELNGDEITCHIPSYRIDIEGKADIDEEIIRLIGYDSLESTLPNMTPTLGRLTPRQQMRRLTQDIMIGFGLNEVMTYTLVSEEFAKDTHNAVGEAIRLQMPMSEARSYIRTGLMNSMLECLKYNEDHGNTDNALYELSTVYGTGVEGERLGLVFDGCLENDPLHKHVYPVDFYTVKGILTTWLKKCGYAETRISVRENKMDTDRFHPYRSAELTLDGMVLGVFGEVHPEYAKKFGLKNVYYAEINMIPVEDGKASKLKFASLDRFPSVTRDIAMVVDRDVTAETILKMVRSCSTSIMKSCEIFDVYEGEHVDAGKKSVALRVVYQADDRTLTDAEVTVVHDTILSTLNKKVGAELRA